MTTTSSNDQDRAGTENQALIDLALGAAGREVLEDDERSAIVVPAGGQLVIVDPVPDAALDAPRRVEGTTAVLNVASFAYLYAKYRKPTSETYANLDDRTITTVVNADTDADYAGHRDHRLILQCKSSTAWTAWTARDGQLMKQVDFAEFIEDRLLDIVTPTGAEMLELAQSFQATTGVEFKSVAVLTSSSRSLIYEETIAAKAGMKGDIQIPTHIDLGLTPFDGGNRYRVRARFRYRIAHGDLALGYRLERPEDVLREAFDDVRTKVAEESGADVLLGSPPNPR